MPGAESMLEMLFVEQARSSKVPGVADYERDYRFDPVRKYELDFAWLGDWLGLEIEGAVWSGGAHGRGWGIVRDIEKGNLLTLAGWRLLRATGEMVNDGTAIAMVERVLGKEGSRGRRPRSRSPQRPRARTR